MSEQTFLVQRPAYPLQIGPNRRHLVDQNGAPVLIHGDTAWSLVSALTLEEVERYLADRQRKGFNSIIVNLIEHYFNGPINRCGEHPFTDPYDLTTPNEKYFAFADRCIELAARYGIQVFLTPLYLGYPSQAAPQAEGWIAETLANGVSKCREYGRYVGQRYAGFDNLVWVMGGDRDPGEALAHVNALAEGIGEYDARHLFTAHTLEEHSPAIEYRGSPWLTLNATYTYNIVHRRLLQDYNRQPIMPFFLFESTYEGEHNASAVQVRRQAYWAILCGGCGQFMGNRPIWGFFEGWPAALDSQASQDMVRLKALFASRPSDAVHPRHRLVPDQKHAVVTGGLGELRGLDTLIAACTDDRSTLIAYMPTPRPVTVDLSQLAGGRAAGQWFDPRTGQITPIGEFPTQSSRTFLPPGEGDWVLVLEGVNQAHRAAAA